MKKITYKIIFATIIIAFSSCSTGSNKNIKEPEEVGKQVFNILKNFDNTGKDDFAANFISIEEIKELANNKELIKDKNVRKAMLKLTKKKWKMGLESYFDKIKKSGEIKNIDWSNIEFKDFEYRVKDERDGKICKGDILFKSGDKNYTIQASSIFDGKYFKLVRIRRLKKM